MMLAPSGGIATAMIPTPAPSSDSGGGAGMVSYYMPSPGYAPKSNIPSMAGAWVLTCLLRAHTNAGSSNSGGPGAGLQSAHIDTPQPVGDSNKARRTRPCDPTLSFLTSL
jgi:hypothetical protein